MHPREAGRLCERGAEILERRARRRAHPRGDRPREGVLQRAAAAMRSAQDLIAREARRRFELIAIDREERLELLARRLEAREIPAQERFAHRAPEEDRLEQAVGAHAAPRARATLRS